MDMNEALVLTTEKLDNYIGIGHALPNTKTVYDALCNSVVKLWDYIKQDSYTEYKKKASDISALSVLFLMRNGTTKRESIYIIKKELEDANKSNPVFSSAHEGYAVLLEELEELRDEIRNKNLARYEDEGKQVGAMAVKFLMCCC